MLRSLGTLAIVLYLAADTNVLAKDGKPLTKCGILDRRGETYVLQNDVSSPGTCFSVQADHVTLDLNGHTITYGTCDENACGWDASIRSMRRSAKKVLIEFNEPLPKFQKPWIKVTAATDPSFNGYFRIGERSSPSTVLFQQNAPDASSNGGRGVVSLRRHAIQAQQCFDPENDGNPCGGQFSEFTIQNGRIVQGPSVGPYSDAIRFGQGQWEGFTAQNVEITIGAPSTKAITLVYGRGGHRLLNNIIRNNVKEIINRHQIDGASIRISNERDPAPSQISGNTLLGSAQGGIAVWSARAVISENKISLTASYTNDFCIYAYGQGQRVYGNVCDNSGGAGRGIHINSQDVEVYSNVFRVQEESRNAEYKGCESGGAYGIQVEGKGTTGNLVHDNDVTALAGQCDAAAFRATSLVQTAMNRVYRNTLRAVRLGRSDKIAAGFTGTDVDGGVAFEGNTFIVDGALSAVSWGGISGIQWRGDTVRVGSNPGPEGWYLFRFSNSAPSTGLRLIDPKFENGASPKSKGIQVGEKGWGGKFEYSVERTSNIQVEDGGSPVPNAKVTLVDRSGTELCSVITGSDGSVSCSVPEKRYFNSTEQSLIVSDPDPLTIQVVAPDGRSARSAVAAQRDTIRIRLR